MKQNPISYSPKGFALVVTLSLMILLTVIAVGLLSLSSISLRSSSQGEASQIARSNAKLALIIALGDLQKALGPDTRASARAETLVKDPRIATSIPANDPKAWWLGATHSDGTTPIGGGSKQPVVWLISGLPNNTITSALSNPVDMIAGGSMDLGQFTGGRPIQAGRVAITNSKGQITGNYAYFVDDEAMKAQLAASHPDVRNDSALNLSGGVLPGTYPISQLRNLTGTGTSDIALIQKLGSTRDLELIGVSKPVAKEKFFCYTTRSQGVLSDSLSGGLKKDLTIAFEKPAVFSKVFPSANANKFIAITPEKLAQANELRTNGYINWANFRDYYNLKTSIKTVSGTQVLAPVAFSKTGFVNGDISGSVETPFYSGALGPHQLVGSGNQSGLPYKQHAFHPGNSTSAQPGNYINNPVFPLLLELKEKAWVEPVSNGGTPALETNVQLFTSHYNPYNVGIYMAGDGPVAGSRVMKYPQVLFTVDNGTTKVINRLMGLAPKLQAHIKTYSMLEPGRSHVMGFLTRASSGNEVDERIYSDQVQSLVNKGVYKTTNATLDHARSYSVTTEFALREPTLMHGIDHVGGENEISQVFFSPFSWARIPAFDGATNARPGKSFTKSLTPAQMTINNASVLQFSLRTTNEANNRVRPLVDANIRAQWNNPRWDSKLNLPILAAYSSDGTGQGQKDLEIKPGSGGRAFSFWGSGRQAGNGYDRVILFDVPRRDLLSIGQLQHASAGRFSYEPTYIVGNSYANPRISLNNWKESTTDTFSTVARGISQWKIGGSFNLYDASYLVNELLWDSYTFSTIPQVADNVGGEDVAADFPALLNRTLFLPNPRYIPYEPAGSKFTAANVQASGNATTGSFFHNAGHLLVDGSFNINSTSVDAWEAFLTGTLDLPVRKLDEKGVITGFQNMTGVRYPRAATPMGDGMKTSSLNEDYWTGFRELTADEVRSLATQIVTEIKDRGPFLTLGSFVNRKLSNGKNGKSGTLQAALDNTVNKGLDASFQSAADSSAVPTLSDNSNQGSGFPGQLLQGDVLQAVGPYMTVHSDTFTIRGYGEAKNPSTNQIVAKAYCEAVVQRLPDPVKSGPSTDTALAELASSSSPFGRQFVIVSFRWLNESEI
jgi:hypothetical protein